MIRSLQPPRIKDVKDLYFASERWEEGLRRQQELTGEPPFNDATKRALLTSMVPDDRARHEIRCFVLTVYDKVRWEVTNNITLASPATAVSMYVDEVTHEDGDDDEKREWQKQRGDKAGGKGKGTGV